MAKKNNMVDDLTASIEAGIAALEKKYGKGCVTKASYDGVFEDVEVISTSSLALDEGLGVGGFAKGRMYETDELECIVQESLAQQNPHVFGIGKKFLLTINTSYTVNLTIVGDYETDFEGPHMPEVTRYIIYTSVETAREIWEEVTLPENSGLHYIPSGTDSQQFSQVLIRFESEDLRTTQTFASRLQGYLDLVLVNEHVVYIQGQLQLHWNKYKNKWVLLLL